MKLKQSLVDQISELQGKVLTINDEDYLYFLLAGDKKEDNKSITWKHYLYKIESDSAIQVPILFHKSEDGFE